jgi:hypothetical protein
MLVCERLEAQNFEKTVASPEKCRQPVFKLSKISNCKIAENHYLDVSTASTGKRKIAATVDFVNPEWNSVIFGISSNKSY